jgi:hypothetical protein
MGAAGFPSVPLGSLISMPPLGGELSPCYLVHTMHLPFNHHHHRACLPMVTFRVQFTSLSMRLASWIGLEFLARAGLRVMLVVADVVVCVGVPDLSGI